MKSARGGEPVRPAILDQLPRAVVRAIDVSEALRNAIFAMRLPEPNGPLIALYAVASYLNSAKRQQRRIERARKALRKPDQAQRNALENTFSDVHFYLICWSRIAKFARFIAQATRFRRARLVLRRYHRDLTERIEFRDHLEHLEERLPGGAMQHRLKNPNDILNMATEWLTCGGRKLDVGPASLHCLIMIVNEFRRAIMLDSVEFLAKVDENSFSSLVHRAANTVRIARVSRRAERMWRHSQGSSGDALLD